MGDGNQILNSMKNIHLSGRLQGRLVRCKGVFWLHRYRRTAFLAYSLRKYLALVKSNIFILFQTLNSGKKVKFYLQPELNKTEIKYFFQRFDPLLLSSRRITMRKDLKLNAIKNNINKQVCSYVENLNPEEGGTILQIVVFFKRMKMST